MAIEQALAEPISGISSMATRHVLAELAEVYRQQSGQAVRFESIGGVEAARRVETGERFDFVVLAANAIDRLADAGRVDSSQRIDFARSGVAIAVKAGMPRPDVATEQAIRAALLGARNIGYSTGPSGAHLTRLLERWGVGDVIAARLVQAPPGVPVGTLIARGDVELGFQQLSELMHEPGIDVVGSLPPEIQADTVFAAAVCRAAPRPGAAMAFLSFLNSPAADAAKRRGGMQPARADA